MRCFSERSPESHRLRTPKQHSRQQLEWPAQNFEHRFDYEGTTHSLRYCQIKKTAHCLARSMSWPPFLRTSELAENLVETSIHRQCRVRCSRYDLEEPSEAEVRKL